VIVVRSFRAVVIVGLLLGAATPLHAQEVRCNGTLLELAVIEEGTSHTDRFQFALRLEAKASSKNDALDELNRRSARYAERFLACDGGLIVSPHALTRLAAQLQLSNVIRPHPASAVR